MCIAIFFSSSVSSNIERDFFNGSSFICSLAFLFNNETEIVRKN